MRQDPGGSRLAHRDRAPRLVVGIIYPLASIYVTNRTAAIANVPGVVIHGGIEDLSSTSQELFPDEGRSTIGSLSLTLTDVDGLITDELRSQLLVMGEGVGRREVRIYTGDTDDFTDGTWRRVETYVVDSAVAFDRGSYQFSCSDAQREIREKIFMRATTRLAADLTAEDTTITVLPGDTENFEMIEHTASFTDMPNAIVGYITLKKTGEIVRYTGKTPNSFTGCARGVFGTIAQAIDIDEGGEQDKWPEVEEEIYLELPAPQLAYAVMTGRILDNDIWLPDSWNAGIDEAFMDADAFRAVGADLFDPQDYEKGLILSFASSRGLGEIDAKRFVEEQLYVPMWSFSTISAEGKIGVKRLTRVLAGAAPAVIAYSDNIVESGALSHEVGAVTNRVIVRWNHNGDRFTREDVYVNAGSIQAHGIGQTREIELLGLTVQAFTMPTVRRLFDAIVDRYGAPPQVIELQLSASLNQIEVGDIVRVVLEPVRDFAALAFLDRSFEVQSRSINWRTGELRVKLFGSSSRTDPDEEDGIPLDDAWYSSEGTALNTVLTMSGDHVTADGSLTGSITDLREAVFYHLGDLIIDSAKTVTINQNVQLRVLGTVTVNGKIDGKGRGKSAIADPNTVDQPLVDGWPSAVPSLGTTQGSGGIIRWGNEHLEFNSRSVPGAGALPPFTIETISGALAGLPSDLIGTPGIWGMGALEQTGGTFVVRALGGAGGASGAGLAVISRGPLAFGASGQIDLSGADGLAPASSVSLGGHTCYGGAGGGGSPGGLLVLSDGRDVPPPDLVGHFVASIGATPQTGNPVSRAPPDSPADPWTGAPIGIGSIDLFDSAQYWARIPMETESGESDDEVIPAPSDLTANADGAGVLLQWSPPPAATYDYVEVWEATTNDRTGAVLLSRRFASSLFVSNAASVTRYYWIRARDDLRGYSAWHPLSPTAGVSATYGGAAGAPGEPAVQVSIALEFKQWQKAPGGTYTPSQTTSDITFTFLQGGSTLATHTVRVTRTGDTIAAATLSTFGDSSTLTVIGNGTAVLTVIVQHDDSGVTGAEGFALVLSGADGTAGADGSDGAPGESFWVPVLSANISQSGKSFSKTASDNAWDSGFYSQEFFGACIAAFQPAQTNKAFMIGLNTDPSSDHSYASIDHSMYCANDGTLQAYESGVATGLGTYATGDALQVQYDGQHVRYVKNGTTLLTVSDSGKKFAIDSSFYQIGAQANNVTFSTAASGKIDLGTGTTGILPLAQQNIAARGWSLTCVFSATDADTVAWGAGSFISADGTTYSISAGNTGNMSTTTYVYLDVGVSTTALQSTTTATTAIGSGKVLVAVAKNSATADEAFFQVFGGVGGVMVTADQIAASTITANEIAATLTWTKDLTISTSGKVRQGKTTAADTTQGFWLGHDGASSYDFHIGDATKYLRWDGSVPLLTVRGNIDILNATASFAPSWGGFSANPSGNISYMILGTVVLCWFETQSLGTSNSGSMSISNWPAPIQPAATREVAVVVYDNGVKEVGALRLNASATAGFIRYNGTAFTGSGSKGAAECVFMYYL